MAKKFADLRAQMSPESRARADAKAQAMLAEMPLNELRQARGLSQKCWPRCFTFSSPLSPRSRNARTCISLHAQPHRGDGWQA